VNVMDNDPGSLGGDFTFDSDGEAAAQTVTAALTRHGLRVVRTFDLRSALAGHAGHEAGSWDCTCPYHGTADCTCQFIVLLVYGEAGAPVVINAHSHDAQTQVRIAHPASGILGSVTTRPDSRLAEQVVTMLAEAALATPVSATIADH
jgi:hypothetical protein